MWDRNPSQVLGHDQLAAELLGRLDRGAGFSAYRYEKWVSTSRRTPHSAATRAACRAVRCP